MPAPFIKQTTTDLQQVFLNDKYISHKFATDELTVAIEKLPTKTLEKVKIYINPFQLFPYLKLKKLILNFESERASHNEVFMEKELQRRSKFFDEVEPYPLDNQQRRAVIADENNSLVIAGAGSGKTSTIVAKVKYLLEVLSVSADTILPISFTNKSAEDMKERINVNGVAPQTFHKFGLTVLQSVENRKPKIFDETNNNKLFRSFVELLAKEQDYLTKLNTFFLNYIKIPKSQFEFQSHGDYIQYLKDQNFTTYKKVKIPFQGRETYRNESVKSIEECIIANFLIFNRIDYEYETQYEHPYPQFGRKKSYKPDFTLLTEDGKVYLEHLGMDRNGNVPAFFAGPNETHFEATRRYRRMLDWKKRVHVQNQTKLVETYSYQFAEGTLVDELKASLINAGIKLNPMTDEEVWQVIQDAGKDQVDGFISICQTFLSLLKSNGHSIQEAESFVKEREDNAFLQERAFLFLDLFKPIYDLYEDSLKQNGEIDFNDMITRATDYINDGDYFCQYSYVIIDEFQDLSFGRYRILDAIRNQNPDVKFYCVGDDWQSIFRFAGSDISLFKDFESYFGFTYSAKIETTYRFNNPLIGMSSNFILKNPNQTPKELKAPHGKPETTHSIIESDSFDGDDTDALEQALINMVGLGLNTESKVYVIGRYNFDIKRIQNRSKIFTINFTTGLIKYTFKEGSLKDKTVNLHFVTAHKSKGLEANYTIIINCNSGKYGFPSGKADDPILNLLLSSADQFENGEERRLFYVAMTRTKRHVTFITDRYKKSKFIKELQDEKDGGRELSCPQCKNGELILRSGKAAGRGFKFYGCSNFAYGCKYSKSFKADENKLSPESEKPKTVERFSTQHSTATAPTQPKRTSSSRLSASESNRLEYFTQKPWLYVQSEKARAKVLALEKIKAKFNDEELAAFNAAHSVWKSKLR